MDLEDLRGRLAAALARYRNLSGLCEPGPLVELTGGWASTSVLQCSLSAPDADGGSPRQAVLKLYGADDAGIRHASREWRALTFLAGTACRVPAVLAFEPDPGVLGRPFVLMDRVPGRSFWSAYESAGGERRDLVRSFVQPLVALHALDARLLEPAAARAQGFGAIDAELAGLHRDVSDFPQSGLDEVVRWLQERRDGLTCDRPVIQHRDYHPWNAVVDDGAVWVLDWDWQVGDPRFDLAWTCALMRRSGHDGFSDAVVAEYGRSSSAALDQFASFEVLTTTRWLLNVLPALGSASRLDQAKRDDFRAFLVEPLRRARTLLRDRTGLDVAVSS